jgi:BASS family bile acid:Na+ symporter
VASARARPRPARAPARDFIAPWFRAKAEVSIPRLPSPEAPIAPYLPILLANANEPTGEATGLVVRIFIPLAIAIITFAMGLGLRPIDFKRVLLEPRAVILGALSQLVLMPTAGFAVAHLFDLPPHFAVGLVLLTAAPGGPSSNLYSLLARGDVALSVTLTAVSGVVTIVTIPLIVGLALDHWLGESRTIDMPVGPTILQIFLVVGLPLALGMFARHHRPNAAIRAERIFTIVSVLLLLILIIGAVSKESGRIANVVSTLLPPVLVVSFGSMVLGLGLAFLGRLRLRQGITIAIEVGMQNGALAIGLAVGSLGSNEMAMPAVVYGLVAYLTCAVWIPIGRWLIPVKPQVDT